VFSQQPAGKQETGLPMATMTVVIPAVSREKNRGFPPPPYGGFDFF
jgi:hypothetical protein